MIQWFKVHCNVKTEMLRIPLLARWNGFGCPSSCGYPDVHVSTFLLSAVGGADDLGGRAVRDKVDNDVDDVRSEFERATDNVLDHVREVNVDATGE